MFDTNEGSDSENQAEKRGWWEKGRDRVTKFVMMDIDAPKAPIKIKYELPKVIGLDAPTVEQDEFCHEPKKREFGQRYLEVCERSFLLEINEIHLLPLNRVT